MSWRPIDEARRWRGKHAGAQVQPTAGYEEGVRSRDYIGLKAKRALLREEQLRLRRLAAAENVQSRDHVEKNERAPLRKDESEERRRSVSERGKAAEAGAADHAMAAATEPHNELLSAAELQAQLQESLDRARRAFEETAKSEALERPLPPATCDAAHVAASGVPGDLRKGTTCART